MFGADVIVVELLGFLLRKREDLLHARCVGNVADHLGLGSGANLLFHFHADGLEIEAHFLEDVDGDSLAQFDEAKKQMFRAHVVVVEPVRFFAGQREHLLRSRREIVHFHHRPLILVRLVRHPLGDGGSNPVSGSSPTACESTPPAICRVPRPLAYGPLPAVRELAGRE